MASGVVPSGCPSRNASAHGSALIESEPVGIGTELATARPVCTWTVRFVRKSYGAETSSSGRQDNLPVRVHQAPDGVFTLEPLAYRGSADHVAVAEADGFAVVPADATIRAGELVSFRPLRPLGDA